MASSFPAGTYYTGVERGPMILLYTPDDDADFVAGDLVVLDTSDDTIDVCGDDPATILGIARSPVEMAFLHNGKIDVEVLSPDVEYGLAVGAGTLAATHEGFAYGLNKTAAGFWDVDLADTTGGTFFIVRADVANQIAWGKFMAAACQFDAIAS